MFLPASLKKCPRGCNLQLRAVLLKIFFFFCYSSQFSFSFSSSYHILTWNQAHDSFLLLLSVFHSCSRSKPRLSHLHIPSLINRFLWLPLPPVLMFTGPSSFQKVSAPGLLHNLRPAEGGSAMHSSHCFGVGIRSVPILQRRVQKLTLKAKILLL